MQDGDTRLDPFPVVFDDFYGLLGFFPGFGGVAVDEKNIGNNVQFLTPLHQVVEIGHIDFFVDDLVAHSLRSRLQSEGEMEQAGLFHLGQQGFVDQVDPNIAFPEDVQFPFDDQVTYPFDSLGVDVEGVIVKEYDLDAVLFDQSFYLVDHILRASHPDIAAPVDRRGAKIAVERTAPAAHDIDRGKFPFSRNGKCEIVLLEGDKMECRIREAVQVLYQRTRGVAHPIAVFSVGYSGYGIQRLEILPILVPSAEFDHGLLTLSADDDVQFGNVCQAVFGCHRRVRPTQEGQGLWQGFFCQFDQLETLESVFCCRCDPDEIRLIIKDIPLDVPPAHFFHVGRDDAYVGAFLLEHSPDIQEPERRHGRALGPAFGKIAAGWDDQLDFHLL